MQMITPLVALWTIAGALMAFFVSMGAEQDAPLESMLNR